MGDLSTYQEMKLYLEEGRFEKLDLLEICRDSKLRDVLLELAMSNDEPAGWRAAWALSHAMKEGTDWLIPVLPGIAQTIPEIERDGHLREVFKFFRDIDFKYYPEEEQGKLFDFCMQVLENNKYQPGTRSNALQILLKFTEEEPLLLGEIKAAFELVKPFLSKGIRSSCERRINRMELENINLE